MVIEFSGYAFGTFQITAIAIIGSHSPLQLYKVGRAYTRSRRKIYTYMKSNDLSSGLASPCPAIT